MIDLPRWTRLRASEWVLVAFFVYVAIISPFFSERPHLRFQPVVVLFTVFVALALLASAQKDPWERVVSMTRDWLPIALTLVAFREMELFVPPHYGHRLEATWILQDRTLLESWHVRAAIESLGRALPFYLEASYFLVYGLPAYCVGLLYGQGRRSLVDRFFTVYLVGTLGAYALFPYFPSQPPRIAFPDASPPMLTTFLRTLNLYILGKATIHAGVFPSAHVSSAFSAVWAMFSLIPERKTIAWALLAYAISVSLATVYGRYHYAIDVVAGFGVSIVAGLLCIALNTHWYATKALNKSLKA